MIFLFPHFFTTFEMKITELSEPNYERLIELEKVELEFGLKIPKEYKLFFTKHDLMGFDTRPKEFVCFRAKSTENYEINNGPILISEFCDIYYMRKWYENFLPTGFFNNEKMLHIVLTYGSSCILLDTNVLSKNYGKVLFYDLEILEDEYLLLSDTFNEFLTNIQVLSEC